MCAFDFEVILGEAGNYLQIARKREEERDQPHDEQLTTVSHLKWSAGSCSGSPFPCHWETQLKDIQPLGFLENHQS